MHARTHTRARAHTHTHTHTHTVFLGFAGCTMVVRIVEIDNFRDSAYGDKTDPYVKLSYGTHSRKCCL